MYAFERAYLAWEDADAEDSSSSDGELTGEEASQELADVLTELKFQNRLSATGVCLISWYGKIAGLQGAATRFAFRPHAPSGHYNRRFKAVLKLDEEVAGSYDLDVPGHDKYSIDRRTHVIPAMPGHESLSAELDGGPGLNTRLRRACSDKEWSDACFNHPVVRSAPVGAQVWPLALYLDGVPFTKRDGLTGWWAYNLVSERRNLLVALRKSQRCQCGCLSWR